MCQRGVEKTVVLPHYKVSLPHCKKKTDKMGRFGRAVLIQANANVNPTHARISPYGR